MTTGHTGFSLLDEQWITVRMRDGSTEAVSLQDLFARATSIREVVGDVPTQAFALLRLALAIVHRATDGPEDERDWQDLRAADGPPVDQIAAYLERHRERFDLFHPETPFFQVADLHTAKGEFSGLEKLLADVPAGHPFFTTRLGSGLDQISAAEAARWLVHVHAFDASGIKSGAVGDNRVKGGKGYPIGTGWAGALGGVYVEGRDLWETLLLNLVPSDTDLLRVSVKDRATWEVDLIGPAEADDLALRPYGLVDLYTWQSRRVLLRGDRDGVTGVLIANGDKLTPQDDRWQVEPMSCWRRSEPQQKKLGRPVVYMPREHDPSRAMWRGLASLLPAAAPRGKAEGGERFVTAAVVEWAARMLGGRDRVSVRAVGMTYGTQSATVTDIVDDRLVVSPALLEQFDPRLPQAAINASEATDGAVLALRNLAANLAKAAGGSDQADGKRERAAERAYALLDAPFRAWLRSLEPGIDPEEARVAWHRTAYALIGGLGDELVASAGPAAWVGRTSGGRRITAPEANGWFRVALATALPVPKRSTPEEDVA
ncbi:type I-E CRISPR-associated protein Cse1/CasA [Cellulomonas hominis]